MQANRWNQSAARRASASAQRSSMSVWQMWGQLTSADESDGRAVRPPVEPSVALMERIRQAHEQRLATGELPRRTRKDPAEAPQDEMLQFVLSLDDRSTVSAYLAPVDPAAGPFDRAQQPPTDGPFAAPLPRRVRPGADPLATATVSATPAPVVIETRNACPSCGGRQLRVDELDLDAGSCTRTCAGCDETFTTPI